MSVQLINSQDMASRRQVPTIEGSMLQTGNSAVGEVTQDGHFPTTGE